MAECKKTVSLEAIQNERAQKLKEHTNAICIGKTKLIYQRADGGFVFNDFYPGVMNAFGLRKENCREFIKEFVSVVKKDKRDLVKANTFSHAEVKIFQNSILRAMITTMVLAMQKIQKKRLKSS